MSGAHDWLLRHVDGAPASLASSMNAAVQSHAHLSTATGLGDAALQCLRTALQLGDDRTAATPLLAADALLTAACEAAGADGVTALADHFAPGRLAAALAPQLDVDRT
jgi:hypothetical protein